jgi:lycopene cyclase domain-containing protein
VITYTLLSSIMIIIVFLIELAVLKSGLLSMGQFWISMAIVTFFQLLSNGFLTSQKIVNYNPELFSGWRIAYAPMEDIFFGFALVSLTMFIWTKIKPSQKKGKSKN